MSADTRHRPGHDQKHGKIFDQVNEGEGNRTADEAYRRGVERTVKSGKVEKKAREAARAKDGPENAELEEAERAGRQHSKGDN